MIQKLYGSRAHRQKTTRETNPKKDKIYANQNPTHKIPQPNPKGPSPKPKPRLKNLNARHTNRRYITKLEGPEHLTPKVKQVNTNDLYVIYASTVIEYEYNTIYTQNAKCRMLTC